MNTNNENEQEKVDDEYLLMRQIYFEPSELEQNWYYDLDDNIDDSEIGTIVGVVYNEDE